MSAGHHEVRFAWAPRGALLRDGAEVGRLTTRWRTPTATFTDGTTSWRFEHERLGRTAVGPDGMTALSATQPGLLSSSWEFESARGRFLVAPRALSRRLRLTVDGVEHGQVVARRLGGRRSAVLDTSLDLSAVEAAFVLWTTASEARNRFDPLDLLDGLT